MCIRDRPIFLPSKATERKIILKKDSLTILGSVFMPPFTLSQLAEKLGPARIVLQNGTRKSPITGRENPYTQALALWDELGLQGWLDEDEQTIKTLGALYPQHTRLSEPGRPMLCCDSLWRQFAEHQAEH